MIATKRYITKYGIKFILACAYIALFVPYIYSIFYSMPANDDFGLGQKWWGLPLVGEAFMRAGWNYMHWFGQSGIIAVLLQVLLNPLYWFKDAGHSYGICMVVVFLLIASGTLYAVRRALKYLTQIKEDWILDLFTFAVAMLLFTSYYYSDVYNWWSGVAGYSLMLMLNILTIGSMLKYKNTLDNTDYKKMIIVGVICCTCLMNCVAIGVFYLFIIAFDLKGNIPVKKRIIPLCLFVISGILMVIAPGNFSRKGEKSEIDIITSIKVTGYQLITRLLTGIKTHPWIILILAMIVWLGYFAGKYTKVHLSIKTVLITIVCTFVATFGAMLPYVVGENKTYTDGFATRIYFVEDYFMFIGAAVAAFALGAWIHNIIKVDATIKSVTISCMILAMIYAGYHNAHQYELDVFIPTDIMAKKEIIKATYELWDGIIDEIEHSESPNVEIHRNPVTWIQYVYPTGLDEGSTWGDLEYYGSCNECASKYYGKESISVYIE